MPCFKRALPIISLLVITVLCILSGCAGGQIASDRSPVREAPEIPARPKPITLRSPGGTPPEASTIGPGSLIRLACRLDRKLNGNYRIDFQGILSLPYGVEIQALGMTPPQFTNRIKRAYASFFQGKASSVQVAILRHDHWIEVRGLVNKPGRYLVGRNASIEEILAAAGGANSNAQPNYLKIRQGSSDWTVNLAQYFTTGEMPDIPPWRGGEVLSLQRENEANIALAPGGSPSMVKVIGEVRSPGEFAWIPDADLLYYITKAGGPTQSADLDSIEIIRASPVSRGPQLIRTTFTDISGATSSQGRNPSQAMMSGDTLLVRADRPSNFQKNLTTTLSITSILSTLALLVIAL